jgi:hypothetical protein
VARTPHIGLREISWRQENKTFWLEEFLVNTGRNYNPFDPKDKTKIRISLFDDDDEDK